MALVNKQMVNAHTAKVYEVILAVGHIMLKLLKPYLHIFLALLQTGKHTATDMAALLTDNVKGFINIAKLILQDLLLDFHGLRYLTKLVMGHNDTREIVILNPVEKLHSISRRKVLLGCIEYLVVGESGLISGGNLGDIGLHGDNHRLIGDAKTVHLVGGHAHDKGLTSTNLMVADATAILQNHLHTVLLGLVDTLDVKFRGSK